MADVRSLLRNELASRRGSPQTGSNAPNRVTKKRKVDPTDSLSRKRVRHANHDQLLASAQIRPPSARAIAEGDEVDLSPQDVMRTDTPSHSDVSQETIGKAPQPSDVPSTAPAEAAAPPQMIDEDEWAAFEREVVAPTRVPLKPAAVAAAATISAAPITTEELAALQEKENESVRRNREAEAEGEREDAARFMEEEFDEMEQLEERVRRLKEKREQLRMKRAMESAEPLQTDEHTPTGIGSGGQGLGAAENTATDDKDDHGDEDDDDLDEDDDWDSWRFR